MSLAPGSSEEPEPELGLPVPEGEPGADPEPAVAPAPESEPGPWPEPEPEPEPASPAEFAPPPVSAPAPEPELAPQAEVASAPEPGPEPEPEPEVVPVAEAADGAAAPGPEEPAVSDGPLAEASDEPDSEAPAGAEPDLTEPEPDPAEDPVAYLRAAISPAAPAIDPDADPAGLAAPGARAATTVVTASSPPAEGSPSGGVARMTAVTEDLIDRGAPWSPRTSWAIVAGEGVVAIVLGLIFLFEPIGGQAVTLQLMGLILLIGALISAFQLWRHHVPADLEVLAAFRSGSGLTVGLVVVVAIILTSMAPGVAAALAVVVGMGYLIFGGSGIVESLRRRRADVQVPLVALAINAVLALAGLVLVIAGAGGSDTVGTIFKLLGIVLIVGGLGLAGYAYLLRQQEVNGVRR